MQINHTKKFLVARPQGQQQPSQERPLQGQQQAQGQQQVSQGQQYAGTLPTQEPQQRPTVRQGQARAQYMPNMHHNSKRALIAAVAVLAAFAVVLLVGLVTCSNNPLLIGNSNTGMSTSAPAYKSPYNFADLHTNTNNRATYTPGGVTKSQLGVDVSDHQGEIDWAAVAADGIDFAYVRAGYRGTTEGGLFVDEAYDTNVSAAQAAGLDVGVYFFSQATNVDEAKEEAAYVLELLGGRSLELPVAFDCEPMNPGTRISNIDSATLTETANVFCSTIEEAGYRTILYGNAYDLARYNYLDVSGSSAEGLYAAGLAPKRAIWFAEYDASEPSASFDFAMWQYANDGTVAGISTAVDMNIRFTEFV